MTSEKLRTWLGQPTTQQGLAVLVLAGALSLVHVFTVDQAIGAAFAALPLLGINDNTVAILQQVRSRGPATAESKTP